MPPAPKVQKTVYGCPVCGKVASAQALEAGAAGEHPIEARIITFHGGGRRPPESDKPRGFTWSRRDLRPDERADLLRIVRAVTSRLAVQVESDTIGVLQDLKTSEEDYAQIEATVLATAQQAVDDAMAQLKMWQDETERARAVRDALK